MPRTAVTPSRTYITTHEAADLVGLSYRTIRRYIAHGQLTGYRVGPRSVRLDQAEVEAMMRPIPTAGGPDVTP